MNYFGHVAIASWLHTAPGALLGSMVPDFATMSGARVADAAGDPDVAIGIALHHQVDGIFHQLPIVTGLMRDLDSILESEGCARGPRRGTAHIGVELLLDGVLVEDPAYRAAYAVALGHDPDVTWKDDGDPARFLALVTRLRRYGPPEDLRDPMSIAERLAHVLGRRPLLRPSPSDLRAIETGLARHQARVTAATPTILHALRGALGG